MAIPPVSVLAVADDLTGAAEVADLLNLRESRISLINADAPEWPAVGDDTAVRVLDLGSRAASPEAATQLLTSAIAACGTGRIIFLKIDSLLRGNVGATVAAAVGTGSPVLLAPSSPHINRVVSDGAVLVDGKPLTQNAAWLIEPTPAPATVADALGSLPVRTVPLSVVRAGHNTLGAGLLEAYSRGEVAVCDAVTDDDLTAVTTAALDAATSAGRPPIMVGAGGLAAALGRSLHGQVDAACPVAQNDHSVLIVVGTAEAGARVQVQRLLDHGVPRVGIDAHELLGDGVGGAGHSVVGEIADRVATGLCVLTLEVAGELDPTEGRQLAGRLGALVAAVLDSCPRVVDLALTGGETARQVLDAVGITELRPLDQIEPGAVLTTTPDGRRIVTRPGSFGGQESLTTIARALGALPSLSTANGPSPARPVVFPSGKVSPPMSVIDQPTVDQDNRPFIAVTMGDGAGVGPEVTVGALLDRYIGEQCRPIVIGDAERLRQAADILGVHAEIVTVERVSDAVFEPGRINVVDLGLLPADLPWGKLSKVAGDAAYHYIRVACELVNAGAVQGICTAPLNKEALHAAGHIYPGHTELLAHFVGVDEVSMMLSTPKVKVIHVTTHIGLIDAVARIEPGLVERTVRRGHGALQRAGIANPKIGVCAINPHAGEGGLFGRGEEAEKIAPAIEVLQRDGIDARGPLPADTAFFLAGRGDYDLIVAMYHDQGHGPVKVLGIEAGVNITVGLPVIRTSVDHGTAFDIAGTGKVDIRSMIEALRQAAEMSPSPAEARAS